MDAAPITVKRLYLRLGGGLGNRIRPILSALFIGHKLQIPLHFRWLVTTSCSCEARHLFEPRMVWENFPGPFLHHQLDHPESVRAFEEALHTQQEIRLRSPVYFESFHARFPDEAERWIAHNFPRYFVPEEGLAGSIQRFAADEGLSKAVGVHVRRGDKVGRVSCLPPLDSYFSVIDRVSEGQSVIFVATDDGQSPRNSEVLQRFRRRYGKRFIYRPKGSIYRDTAGMQDAVIDLWLLRTCAKFIGTKCSTFSETVGIGGRPILL